jgi:hypothetical protein
VLTGEVSLAGKTNYVAVDDNGHAIKNGVWNINMTSQPNWLNIDNQTGMLSWTTACIEGTFQFTISYASDSLVGTSGQITLEVKDTPLPAPTSISIMGSQDLIGVSGYSGYSYYIVFDNNGRAVNGTWYITNSTCKGITVGSNGIVNWDKIATSGQFTLNCDYLDLNTSITINLTIHNEEPPSDYVGNETGTDWKGYQSGTILIDCIYETSDSLYAEIILCNNYKADNLIIPSWIRHQGRDFPITTIHSQAFSGSFLTGNLTLNEGLKEIGYNAFDNSYATGKLTLPFSLGDGNSSELGVSTNAFYNCSFSELVFDRFNSMPTNNWYDDVFAKWQTNGIVSVINGSWEQADALAFAKSKGLPNTWL